MLSFVYFGFCSLWLYFKAVKLWVIKLDSWTCWYVLLSNPKTFLTTLVAHSNGTMVAGDVGSSMTSTLSTSIEMNILLQHEVFNRYAHANPCPKYRQCKKSILGMIGGLLSTICQNFRILPIHHRIHIIGSSLIQGYKKFVHTCFVQARAER